MTQASVIEATNSRLVYLEDEYLWSVDVARIFAARCGAPPRLHLVAVVPYRTDAKEQADVAALGRSIRQGSATAPGGSPADSVPWWVRERRPGGHQP